MWTLERWDDGYRRIFHPESFSTQLPNRIEEAQEAQEAEESDSDDFDSDLDE
jgi:hypothetical protein